MAQRPVWRPGGCTVSLVAVLWLLLGAGLVLAVSWPAILLWWNS
jgi:hypothetical protein